jgi:chromosome segregation ATPase
LYLKDITLRGFKSFAKKSKLTFDKGINVIVGPNGSGKSNIVDAISWVLGEQSAKSLRGNSMEDIIFRSKKEELSIAEVSLLFDNSDRFLPLSFNEINFKRRVFQKGGSEYFINSTPSRLMDIQDITLERGIGKGLYTIINQGQIDDIALLKPADRKKLIDELIGISKHKIRRERSKNKLDGVRGDIDRINSLVNEVKRTMDPLQVEAKKAQEYSAYKNRLKEAEMTLFVTDIKDLNKLWDKDNEKCEDIRNKVADLEDKVIKIENEKSDFENKFSNKQKILDETRIKIEKYNFFNNRLDAILDLAESKKNIFKTMQNMLIAENASMKISSEILSEKTKKFKNSKDIGELYIKKLIEIKDRINNFYENIKDFIQDISIKKEFEQSVNSLIKEISELITYIEKENGKKERSSEADDRYTDERINSSRIEIRKRMELIKNLELYNKENQEKTNQFIELFLSFRKSLNDHSKRFLKIFDLESIDINAYNSRLNDYISNINKLNLSKQNLENELYRIDVRKEQVKAKVKDLTEDIVDNYNLPVEYIFKNYKTSENTSVLKEEVKKLKKEIKRFGTVNPNAAVEYKKIKERYDFLEDQKGDLINSRTRLEGLIEEINKRIDEIFNEKFDLINKNFDHYFKALFPIGNGEMILINNKTDSIEYGVELKVDIGNDKMVSLSLLSGGEKALVSIAFLFSIFSTSYSPFYVFDEIDAALDDVNLNRFVSLVKRFSKNRQIIIVTHQKKTMEIANTIYGVTMQSNSVSKVVSEKLDKNVVEAI